MTTPSEAESVRRDVTPKQLYGGLAAAEMVTWALLIGAMVLKYTDTSEAFVPVFGLLHGVVFLAYGVVTLFVWVNQRWSTGRGLAGLASAIVPFATWPFERATLRSGLLEGPWRLRPGGDDPDGVIEQIQARMLRRPLIGAALALIAIALITTALLMIGPPVPRG